VTQSRPVFVGAPFIVVYDASVLFPAPVRDALIRVAEKGLVQAKWTDEINDEWIEAVPRTRDDVERAKLERTRDLMNAAIRECLVTASTVRPSAQLEAMVEPMRRQT